MDTKEFNETDLNHEDAFILNKSCGNDSKNNSLTRKAAVLQVIHLFNSLRFHFLSHV